MQIQEKPPAATPFEWIGGEERVKALTERFYDLMELEPGYAALRGSHGSTLDNARQRLFMFLCGWLGGPQYYTEQFGQWLACMDQAMGETGVDEALRARLRDSFFQTADWMRNQGV
jgi:hemoglobin